MENCTSYNKLFATYLIIFSFSLTHIFIWLKILTHRLEHKLNKIEEIWRD